VYLDALAIAGKTGTTETTPSRPDHAWFAGYVPADVPRYAFAVVVEHGGSGASAAGPLAQRLLDRMQQRGYFERHQAVSRSAPERPGTTAR
jgi:cell division protein FtsI/penicillin-binding protein 2